MVPPLNLMSVPMFPKMLNQGGSATLRNFMSVIDAIGLRLVPVSSVLPLNIPKMLPTKTSTLY